MARWRRLRRGWKKKDEGGMVILVNGHDSCGDDAGDEGGRRKEGRGRKKGGEERPR